MCDNFRFYLFIYLFIYLLCDLINKVSSVKAFNLRSLIVHWGIVVIRPWIMIIN